MKRIDIRTVGILGIFFLLRLVYIFRFPLFTDESSYIRWGQLMVVDDSYQWSSMALHSKQPLMFWLYGFGAVLTGSIDYGPRFIALVIGLLTVFATYSWIKIVSGTRTARISLLVLATMPVFIHFQSLALMEVMVLAVTAYTFWFLALYRESPKILYLVCLGSVFGIGLWTKTNVLILVVAVLCALGIDTVQKKRYVWVGVVVIVPVLVMFIVLFPLLLHPDFLKIFANSEHFTFSVSELVHFPIGIWKDNVLHAMYSIVIYGGPLSLLCIVAYIYQSKRMRHRYIHVVTAMLLGVPVIINTIMSARYYLPAFIPLLLYVSTGLGYLTERSRLLRRVSQAAVCLQCLASVILVAHAPWFFGWFPNIGVFARERDYAFGWTSGYATREAFSYIVEKKEYITTPAFIAVPDYLGNPSDYLLAKFYYDSPDFLITILDTPRDFYKFRGLNPNVHIYYVTRESIERPYFDPYLVPIVSFEGQQAHDKVLIYEVQKEKL